MMLRGRVAGAVSPSPKFCVRDVYVEKLFDEKRRLFAADLELEGVTRRRAPSTGSRPAGPGKAERKLPVL